MTYPFDFFLTEDDVDVLRVLSEEITIKKGDKKIKLKRTRLRRKILEFIALNYSISAPQLCEKFRFSKANRLERSNARKYLRSLDAIELVEIASGKSENGIPQKFYQISSKGLYYLISNNKEPSQDILKPILQKHDHILFQLFLYPYIQRTTLLSIDDTAVFSTVYAYLYDCCKNIEQLLIQIDNTYNSKNGNLLNQLFIWNNIPKEEYDKEALHNFLMRKFKSRWDWLRKADIRKTSDENITVSYGSNTILISLDHDHKGATLAYKGKKVYTFIVTETSTTRDHNINNGLKNRLIVYVDEFETLPWKGYLKLPLVKVYLEHFKLLLQLRIMKLVFSLSLIYWEKSPAVDILAKDGNFIKQLNITKHHFEKWYNFFPMEE